MALEWVKGTGENVYWQQKARWVVDGKYYTASGVSAGIDMSLGFVSDTIGESVAEEITRKMEYIRNKNKEEDAFAI